MNLETIKKQLLEDYLYIVESGESQADLNELAWDRFESFSQSIQDTIIKPDVYLCPNGSIDVLWSKNKDEELLCNFRQDEFSFYCKCGGGIKGKTESELSSTLNTYFSR